MKVECLHLLEEVAILRTRINELNLKSATPDPFGTFEYFENIIANDPSYFGGGVKRLWFLAAFREDALVGFVALKEVRSWCLWRSVSTLDFLVGHDTDRPHVVAAEADVAAVTDAFLAYLSGRHDWDLVEFQQQSEESSLRRLVDLKPLRRIRRRSWPTMTNYSIAMRWNSTSDYFLTLSKKFRSETKRQLRRLVSVGRIELLSSSDAASTPALFDLYCLIESRSWKASTELAIGSDVNRSAFMRGLLAPNQPMQMVLHVLLLDSVPIAALINGSFLANTPAPLGRKLYALHVAFDERYSDIAPGAAILLMGIRYAIEGRYDTYNLLSGFGYYKTRLLASGVSTQAVQLYRANSPLYWRRLFGDLKRRITKKEPDEKGVDVRDGKIKADIARPVNEAALSPKEFERVRRLVLTAKLGQCEYLDAEAFEKVLQLDKAKVKKQKGPRNQAKRDKSQLDWQRELALRSEPPPSAALTRSLEPSPGESVVL